MWPSNLSTIIVNPLQNLILSIVKILIEVYLSPAVWKFVQSKVTTIPRYIRLLLYIYNSETPGSTIHKYVTITLLLLSVILSTLANSFLTINIPILGMATSAIALLVTLAIILGTMEIILTIYGEDYFNCVKDVNLKEDIREIKKLLGPTWDKLIKQIQESFDILSPIIEQSFKEFPEQIENRFKNNLPDLYIYISPLGNNKIIFKKSDIKKIKQGLETWEKTIISLTEGAVAGGTIGFGLSSLTSSIFVTSSLWTSLLSSLGVSTGIAVSSSAFTLLTIGLPITLAMTGMGGVMWLGYSKRTNDEKERLSKFLTNTTIAMLPMAHADGVFCQQEKDTIHQFLQNIAISNEDHHRAYKLFDKYWDFEQICQDNILLKVGHPTAKLQHIFLLLSAWELAKVDGIIHPKEFELFERMTYILKIDRRISRGIQNLVTPRLMIQECDYITPIRLNQDSIPLLSIMNRFD